LCDVKRRISFWASLDEELLVTWMICDEQQSLVQSYKLWYKKKLTFPQKMSC